MTCECKQFLVIVNKLDGEPIYEDHLSAAGLVREVRIGEERLYLPTDVYLTTGTDPDQVLSRIYTELRLDDRSLIVAMQFDEIVHRGLVSTPSRIYRSVGKPPSYVGMPPLEHSTERAVANVQAVIKSELFEALKTPPTAVVKHKIPLNGLSPAAREIAERQYKTVLLSTAAPFVKGRADLDRVIVPDPDLVDPIAAFFDNNPSLPPGTEQLLRLTYPAVMFSKVATVNADGSIDPKYFNQFLGAFQKLVDDQIVYFGVLAPPSYLLTPVINGVQRAAFFFFVYPQPRVYENFVSSRSTELHTYLNHVSSVKGFVAEGMLGDGDWSTLSALPST